VSPVRIAQKSVLQKLATFSVALALAGLIGALGYATGYELHLTAFYLVPICWVGWTVGRRAGLVLAIACTLIWLVADLLTGHPYKYPLIPYWNAITLLGFFVVIVLTLSGFHAIHRKLIVAQSILENQNEHLEETVRQRTAALESEIEERKALEKAKLRAERLAMVGTIAAQVAHEVRNPLGSITLNLDLITKEINQLAASKTHPAQEGRTLVNEMREEVRRIQNVIENYLQFARLPKPQREPLRLNDFIGQKLDFMRASFENAGVLLQTNFDPELETVNVDAEQLWQALLNLVRNSQEAMPLGGVLAISTQRDCGQAFLRVADTGKGMTAEQMGQLFVPFYTTKPCGTGLGLSLTQQILNEHGAQIECASTVGKGTTFTIIFPLDERNMNVKTTKDTAGGR
jgi:signal transduction histidine kinase